MIFKQYPIFGLFWLIFGHNFRTTRPNLIIFTPIDRSFNYDSFGIYKVKNQNFCYRTFQNQKKNLSKGRTGSTQLGTLENNFFRKAIFGMSLYQKKKISSDERVKSY